MVSCSLRRASADDAAMFVRWRGQPSVRQYQPIVQLSVDEMAASLDHRAFEPISPTFNDKIQWVILADEVPAGWVSMTVVSRSHAIANAGYTIAEEFRGCRLAGRALIQACEIAFDRNGLAIDRIEASSAVSNVASAKTLEFAGFTREGIARGHLIINGIREDHYRYGRLASDPEPTL